MGKFKVGDKVILRHDLKYDTIGNYSFPMYFEGISYIKKEIRAGYYILEHTLDNKYLYTDDMLLPATSAYIRPKFKKGDFVQFKTYNELPPNLNMLYDTTKEECKGVIFRIDRVETFYEPKTIGTDGYSYTLNPINAPASILKNKCGYISASLKKYDAPLRDAGTSKSNIKSMRKNLDNVDWNTVFDWPKIKAYGKLFSVYDIINDINNQEKSVLSDDKIFILQIHKNKPKLKFNFN